MLNMNVFRIFVVILAALSILWIPLVKTRQSGQLFVYIIVVQGYLATPIGPIFLIAILWKRMTEKVRYFTVVQGCHDCKTIVINRVFQEKMTE